MTIDQLSTTLIAQSLIPDGRPLTARPDLSGTPTPWYVQVMLGVCAWFAGLFLLGFTVAAFGRVLFQGHDEWLPLLVLGCCSCLAAGIIYSRVGEQSAFGSQFALAFSLAGQMGIIAGIGGTWGVRAAIWGALLLEIILTAVMQNRLHRVLSSLGAVIAWALATHEFLFRDVPGVSFPWGAPHPDQYELSAISILLWLIVWAPVAAGAWWLVRNEARWMSQGRDDLMRPVTSGVIASLSIAPLATHPAAFWMALGLGSSRDLTDGSHGATALWPLLAMFLVLLGMALAFTLRSRSLIGLAILFGLLEISGFYYILGTTLLVKSIIMAVLGIALLLGARWLEKGPA
ncbi:MAG TPA: DUF4401 domain-containing protein [Bryobacteraceae bacterium]|jgi:hypothetical protein